jgi:cell wall-associated NlpC family hydrolase
VATFAFAVVLLAVPATSHAQVGTGGSVFTTEPDPTVATPPPAGSVATIDSKGRAVAPADAPKAVKQIIAAGNKIAFKPYIYGGGHRSWRAKGYDCSGSVSYALRGAKLLKSPLASGGYMKWGEAGPGSWVTIYTKSSHMYAVIAGLRFDTSGKGKTGSRWQTAMRPATGYTVRHPEGL